MSPRDAGTLPPSPGDRTATAAADWIKLGRHDLAALFHGLRDLRDIGAWALLIAHYLSAPGPLSAPAIVDILPLDEPKTAALLDRLRRLRRTETDGEGQLRIPMLDDKLTAAATATARGSAKAQQRWRRDG